MYVNVHVSLSYPVCLSGFPSLSGYNVVVRIPAGATNIDIKQVSYSGKPEDDNYLGECVSQERFWKNCFPWIYYPVLVVIWWVNAIIL